MWFETVIPGEEKSFFVVAQPPEQIPQPEIGQNELLTIEMNLTIEEYKGLDATVALTTGGIASQSETNNTAVADFDEAVDETLI